MPIELGRQGYRTWEQAHRAGMLALKELKTSGYFKARVSAGARAASKSWLKIKNPKSPVMLRIEEKTF
jgi:hypothetical protein